MPRYKSEYKLDKSMFGICEDMNADKAKIIDRVMTCDDEMLISALLWVANMKPYAECIDTLKKGTWIK